MGQFERSLEYYKTALSLNPNNSATYSAIGLAHCYLGNYQDAIAAFHNALSIHRDDTISQELLVYALNTLSEPQLLVEEISYVENEDNANDTTNDDSNIEMDDASMIEES